jgi:hypothetical protein
VLTANLDAHWTFISKAQLVEGWFVLETFRIIALCCFTAAPPTEARSGR